MNYQALKTSIQTFTQAHPGYVWFVLELSMLFAAGYSVFGLILVSTGALASGDTLRMLLGFIFAPVYALMLFIMVTILLAAILTLPYVFITSNNRSIMAFAAAKPSRKSTTRKPASQRRKTAAKATK
jgi:Flp pilus assembly protein protease CpaA